MTRILLPAVLSGLAACSAPPSGPAQVEVADAVCRPTPNGRDTTGCYVTLTASTEDRLVSVASAAARDIQVHEMSTEGGVMRMAEMADGLPLPAGETVALAPGGTHLMLIGAVRPLASGETAELTLTFARAPARTVAFRIGQPAPAEHGGH